MTLDDRRVDGEIFAFLEAYADELVAVRRPEHVSDAIAARLAGSRWAAPTRGVGWVLLMLALLAAALPAILYFGGRPEQSLSDLVQRSQAASRDAPPFVMTIELADGAQERFSYDGDGRARIESIAAGAEGFGNWIRVSDGMLEAFYDPGRPTGERWTLEDLALPALARLPVSWWVGLPIDEGATELPLQDCRAPQRLNDRIVAGRQTIGVACQPYAFWIDTETLLVLRAERDGQLVAAVTELDLAPRFAAGIFDPELAASGPQGSPQPGPVGVGEFHEPWSGALLGGGDVSIGQPSALPRLVYAWADWCDDACFRSEVLTSVIQAQRRHAGQLEVLTAAVCSEPTTTRDAAVREGFDGLPIAVDQGCELLDLWRREGVPFLLLYARDGSVAAAWGPDEQDPFPSDDALDAAISALSGGTD